MSKHGLTSEQITVISQIFEPFADKIEIVGLFGSRAQGTYRDNSDIDLVVKGTLNEKDIDRLYTLFDESILPFQVDINAYNLLDYAPLKDHIDAVFLPLLTQQDLQ